MTKEKTYATHLQPGLWWWWPLVIIVVILVPYMYPFCLLLLMAIIAVFVDHSS
jgi:hypothetical protein